MFKCLLEKKWLHNADNIIKSGTSATVLSPLDAPQGGVVIWLLDESREEACLLWASELELHCRCTHWHGDDWWRGLLPGFHQSPHGSCAGSCSEHLCPPLMLESSVPPGTDGPPCWELMNEYLGKWLTTSLIREGRLKSLMHQLVWYLDYILTPNAEMQWNWCSHGLELAQLFQVEI